MEADRVGLVDHVVTDGGPPRQPDPARVIAQTIPRPHHWEPGPPGPWEHLLDWQPTLSDLVAVASPVLSPAAHDTTVPPEAQLSGVLVVLRDGPDGPEVLLTRRALAMRSHAGEISFPGGRADPGETARAAALREADEEVGLAPHVVVVHGELAHLHTWINQSYIVPILASITGDATDEASVAPRTDEVDRVLWVPCRDLLAPGTHHTERWMRPERPAPLGDIVLHFFDLDHDIVWGATARILADLFTRAASQTPLK